MTFTQVIPVISVLTSIYRFFSRAKKTSTILKVSDNLATVIKTAQTATMSNTEIDYIESKNSINSLIDSMPTLDDTMNITTTAPSTMPEYLSQQNEHIRENTNKLINLSEHTRHANDLLSKSLQLKSDANVSVKIQADMISSLLPALVMQMQEIAKISSILSVKTDTETAYRELALTNHEQLISTLENLNVTSSVNVVPSEVVIQNNVNVASQSVALENLKTATDAQTTELAKVATNLDSVSANATVQKTIADYQVTPVAIKNLDGNTVATIKPMEAQAVKNIVNAKNATDEMEFELDDDILDSVFSSIALPEYTLTDWTERDRLQKQYAGLEE